MTNDQSPDLPIEQKMKLFYVLQKAFMLGFFAGKGQLQMSQGGDMVESAVQNSIKNLNEIYPGSDVQNYMAEIMAGIKLK